MKIKKETEYQYRWLAKKKKQGFKLITLLLPTDLELPVKTYSKYLLSNYRNTML